MKPQQQNTDNIGHSHVYVQTPEGEQINVPAPDPSTLAGKRNEQGAQVASKTPTTHSGEVADGEDA